jgi:hypothetical protein
MSIDHARLIAWECAVVDRGRDHHDSDRRILVIDFGQGIGRPESCAVDAARMDAVRMVSAALFRRQRIRANLH